ncbi:RNA dependent RNA polymerase-domain-containing protein [Mycena polygramma]|nr:RNA dependent RNA polymerase-domain-containing protein [Mycena polygramma]
MGDAEMSMSQVAYNQLDESYPAEFWDAVLKMDRPLTSTQSSSDSDTAVDSASTSLTDVSDAGATGSHHSSKVVAATSGTKRPAPQTGLPPAKMRRLDAPRESRVPGPRRNAPPPRVAAGVKPASVGPPSDTFSLQYLFQGCHGQDLESYVISHSAEVQPQLDGMKIARGVQWELVRGIQLGEWTWDDVKANLDLLKGPNAVIAPAVRSIMRGTPPRNCTPHELALWYSPNRDVIFALIGYGRQELDREAKATVENKSRGLGLMGEFEGVPDYYGGNVQCTIRLLYSGENQTPKVRLEPLQMTRSHHLARDLGSVSVIALRDDKDGALVKQWALRKFIFCGRTYIALPPKSSKVSVRISYDDYIRKNNPMHLNEKQPFAKYLTRLNLYLSTSIPVLEFSAENILYIDDQYADKWSKDQRPPTEMIMTDGCGFLNRAAALTISARLKYERLPVAYQGRIAGSKGMWILHPSDESPEPKIWIRDSQKKIQLSRLLRAHRIFDLLAVSTSSSSSHLSAQSIIILANNGVPASVFCALQEQGLRDVITPLMDWKRPNATAYLWNAINDVSNVTRSRLQRLAAGASRALGFENAATKTPIKGTTSTTSIWTYGSRHIRAGTPIMVVSTVLKPLIVPEAAMDLLQAGFDPLETPYLSFKLHNFIKSAMDSYLARYRIPLGTSLEAYIIPDPSGKLQEGQVFYKSSRDPDGPLREEVVIGRYPMRESSDMQKVTAVDIPELADYVDVLIMPIHGSRSLASLLAGGDTDGDEAIIIRDPTIVAPFKNQPVQIQSVTDFGNKLEKMTFAQAQRAFQAEVLTGLQDDRVGVYSLYHDTAVYEWGLNDPKTRRMAHMHVVFPIVAFHADGTRRTTTLLDASKTGLRLKKKVEEADQRSIGQTQLEAGSVCAGFPAAAGMVTKDELQAKFETEVATHLNDDEDRSADQDIEEPYHRMTVASVGDSPLAVAIAADLKVLRDRILDLRTRFQDANREVARSKNEPQPQQHQQRKKGRPKQTDNCMLPIMRDFRQPFEGLQCLLHLGNIEEIKGSYAFALGYKFGFSMAFQDICEIKRRAEMKRGPFNRVAVIDEARSMGGPARRLFKHMGDQG